MENTLLEQDAASRQAREFAPGATSDAPGRRLITSIFAGSSWLTIIGFMMLADMTLSLGGLLVDRTIISGAPTWLKPLKFGISTMLFSFTVAFMLSYMHHFRRLLKVVGRILALGLMIEIILIDLQAARHTTSHFNQTTNFDKSVYAAMGITIGVIFLSTIVLYVASCFEEFTDHVLGRAIRYGLALALAGMSVGALMTLPTPQQLAEANSGRDPGHIGAHTIGAPDGGKSLPGIGWSADHGDLRIAHFLGLHAMQILMFAWWLTSRRTDWPQQKQLSLESVVALTCSGAFSIVLWQALRAQPLLRPNTQIVAAWIVWLVAVAVGAIWVELSATKSSDQRVFKA
jgi:hypothetical protein